jgi:hypothetical protein
VRLRLCLCLPEQVIENRKCFLALGQSVKNGFYVIAIGQWATGMIGEGTTKQPDP